MTCFALHARTRLAGVAVLCCVVGLAGCHHQNRQTYAPPAPDVTEAAPSHADAAGIARKTSPAASAPTGEPAADALRGKPAVTEVGLASWYGPPYSGRKGADGSVYDQNAMTAASLTLALGTMVRVTNLANEQAVVVRITDRGPFVRGRIIDLSLAAAKASGVYRAGVAKVRVEAYPPPPSPTGIPGGRWCVQVGAFYNADDAIQLKNDLMLRYATAKVIEFQGPTGFWVRINPKFANKATAIEIADGIHIPDADPYLTRTD